MPLNQGLRAIEDLDDDVRSGIVALLAGLPLTQAILQLMEILASANVAALCIEEDSLMSILKQEYKRANKKVPKIILEAIQYGKLGRQLREGVPQGYKGRELNKLLFFLLDQMEQTCTSFYKGLVTHGWQESEADNKRLCQPGQLVYGFIMEPLRGEHANGTGIIIPTPIGKFLLKRYAFLVIRSYQKEFIYLKLNSLQGQGWKALKCVEDKKEYMRITRSGIALPPLPNEEQERHKPVELIGDDGFEMQEESLLNLVAYSTSYKQLFAPTGLQVDTAELQRILRIQGLSYDVEVKTLNETKNRWAGKPQNLRMDHFSDDPLASLSSELVLPRYPTMTINETWNSFVTLCRLLAEAAPVYGVIFTWNVDLIDGTDTDAPRDSTSGASPPGYALDSTSESSLESSSTTTFSALLPAVLLPIETHTEVNRATASDTGSMSGGENGDWRKRKREAATDDPRPVPGGLSKKKPKKSKKQTREDGFAGLEPSERTGATSQAQGLSISTNRPRRDKNGKTSARRNNIAASSTNTNNHSQARGGAVAPTRATFQATSGNCANPSKNGVRKRHS